MDAAKGSRVLRAATRRFAAVGVLALVVVLTGALVAALGPRGGAAGSPPSAGAGESAADAAVVTGGVDAAAFAAAGAGASTAGNAALTQIAPTDEPSVVVSGIGQSGGPAETATLQFLVSAGGYDPFGFPVPNTPFEPESTAVPGEAEEEPAPGASPDAEGPDVGGVSPEQGPARVTEEALEPIVQALIDAGAPEEEIVLIVSPALSSFFGPGGPGGGRVDAVVEDPDLELVNDLVNAVGNAADENNLLLQQVGVLYDVADCSGLEREARQEAIDNARSQVEQLAELLGVELGQLLQASENSFFFPPFSEREGGCAPNPDYGFYGPGAAITAPPFDPLQEPEAKAYSQVTMVFAIEEGDGTS